ncbi:hypothetical protein HG531_006059 [Fusarium graminearum]|nr:hypothetical protein HG531_006059 [Fusarium graminearum]
MLSAVSKGVDRREFPGDLMGSVVFGTYQGEVNRKSDRSALGNLERVAHVTTIHARLGALLDLEAVFQAFNSSLAGILFQFSIFDDVAKGIINFVDRVLPFAGRGHGLVKANCDLSSSRPRNIVLVIRNETGGSTEERRGKSIRLKTLEMETVVLAVDRATVLNFEGRCTIYIQ